MRRCKWCGRFVRADQQPTTRSVQGVVDGVVAWRTFTQLLCPEDSAHWSQDLPWNEPAS